MPVQSAPFSEGWLCVSSGENHFASMADAAKAFMELHKQLPLQERCMGILILFDRLCHGGRLPKNFSYYDAHYFKSKEHFMQSLSVSIARWNGGGADVDDKDFALVFFKKLPHLHPHFIDLLQKMLSAPLGICNDDFADFLKGGNSYVAVADCLAGFMLFERRPQYNLIHHVGAIMRQCIRDAQRLFLHSKNQALEYRNLQTFYEFLPKHERGYGLVFLLYCLSSTKKLEECFCAHQEQFRRDLFANVVDGILSNKSFIREFLHKVADPRDLDFWDAKLIDIVQQKEVFTIREYKSPYLRKVFYISEKLALCMLRNQDCEHTIIENLWPIVIDFLCVQSSVTFSSEKCRLYGEEGDDNDKDVNGEHQVMEHSVCLSGSRSVVTRGVASAFIDRSGE